MRDGKNVRRVAAFGENYDESAKTINIVVLFILTRKN
jgi:deferrochelatase/peroxidase EfeB